MLSKFLSALQPVCPKIYPISKRSLQELNNQFLLCFCLSLAILSLLCSSCSPVPGESWARGHYWKNKPLIDSLETVLLAQLQLYERAVPLRKSLPDSLTHEDVINNQKAIVKLLNTVERASHRIADNDEIESLQLLVKDDLSQTLDNFSEVAFWRMVYRRTEGHISEPGPSKKLSKWTKLHAYSKRPWQGMQIKDRLIGWGSYKTRNEHGRLKKRRQGIEVEWSLSWLNVDIRIAVIMLDQPEQNS